MVAEQSLFILASSNLTLEQSIFIKQIIPAPSSDPQNNFGSTGSAHCVQGHILPVSRVLHHKDGRVLYSALYADPVLCYLFPVSSPTRMVEASTLASKRIQSYSTCSPSPPPQGWSMPLLWPLCRSSRPGWRADPRPSSQLTLALYKVSQIRYRI